MELLGLVAWLVAQTSGAASPQPAQPAAPPLLDNTGKLMALVTAAGIVGGAITWAASQAWKVWERRSEKQEKEDGRVIDHQAKLIERLDREKAQKDAQIAALEHKLARLGATVSKYKVVGVACKQHIQYMQRLAKEKGFEFVPFEEPKFEDEDASGTYAPLGPATAATEPVHDAQGS